MKVLKVAPGVGFDAGRLSTGDFTPLPLNIGDWKIVEKLHKNDSIPKSAKIFSDFSVTLLKLSNIRYVSCFDDEMQGTTHFKMSLQGNLWLSGSF